MFAEYIVIVCFFLIPMDKLKVFNKLKIFSPHSLIMLELMRMILYFLLILHELLSSTINSTKDRKSL